MPLGRLPGLGDGDFDRDTGDSDRGADGFPGGGVIMNVLKEELPEERESRFWAFALGVALYTVILLAL